MFGLQVTLLLCTHALGQSAAGAPSCQQFVVAALPFDSQGSEAGNYQVLKFTPATNGLEVVSKFILDGPLTEGRIAFTDDGEYGVVPLKNGNLGVFQLDCVSGAATVIAGNFTCPDFVKNPVRDSLTRDQFWVSSDRAVYSLRIDRANASVVVDETPYLAAYIPATFQFLDGLGADQQQVLMTIHSGVVNLIDWPTKQILATASGWPRLHQPIVSDACVLGSGAERHLLMLDDDQFAANGNTCGIVRLSGLGSAAPAITRVQVIPKLVDPSGIACSPFHNAAVISTGQGNSLVRISYDPSDAKVPFANAGPVPYTGGGPQLPGTVAAASAAGASPGRVFVAELSGVRQLQFQAGGSVTDLGLFSFGSGTGNICGGIGSSV